MSCRLAALVVVTLLGLAFTGALAQDANVAGALRGTVYDAEFGVPLVRARVTIVELGLSALTNEDGVFLFERIPPGTYTLTFTKEGFERALATGVAVTIGRMSEAKASLSPEVVELEELVVTGLSFTDASELGLLEVRAVAVTVQDAISSDLIRKAGVGDVAGALKLVTGASVVEGKYATVRGLSDRYTGVTLNGVRVPSADPRKRAAQIDLFPTGTIDSITVTKTFTPDLQGDFTGGGVDIRTRSIPDGPILSVSVSGEHNSSASGNARFLTYAGGGVEWTGVQDGSRDLPALVDRPFPKIPAFIRPTPEDVANAAFYDQAVNAFVPVMGVRRAEPDLGHGFSLVAGNSFGLGSGKLGLIGSLTYSHKYEYFEGGFNNTGQVSTSDADVFLKQERVDSKGTDELLWGFLGSAVYQPNDEHEFSLKLIGNQSATDEARLQALNLGPDTVQFNQSLQYAERTVGSLQLQGRNRFPLLLSPGGDGAFADLEIVWSGSANYTRQDEPDVRFFRNNYSYLTGQSRQPLDNATAFQNTRRIWRNIEEKNGQGSFDTILPFRSWAGGEGRIKVGAFLENSDRTYEQRSYTYIFPTQVGPGSNPAVAYNRSLSSYVSPDVEDLWTNVFLEDQRTGLADNRCVVAPAPCTGVSTQLLWYVQPVGDDVDYVGDQQIDALYAMAELPLTDTLRFVGGVRREATELTIVPTNYLSGTVELVLTDENLNRRIEDRPQEEGIASIKASDVLPAAGLIWEMRERMNLRGSWARTLARPTFRELAPVATEEFIFGDEFLGNPGLVLSSIDNFDLRWEWFPSAGTVLAGSIFHKDITDPIEYISFGASNRAFVQPVNYESGTVDGFEVEARANLDLLWDRLRNFSGGVNATLIESEVDVPVSEQDSLRPFGLAEETRRLQGQPEYIANVSLTYDNSASGTAVGVFYNMIGEILASGAARGNEDGVPDVYESSFTALDVTFSQRIGPHLTVAAKATNVLVDDRKTLYRVPDGRETLKSLRTTSRNISLGVSYKW